MSGIEWTDRSDWNPIRGCTRVSEGCRNCYAEAIAARFSGPGQPFHGFAERTPHGPRWTGKVALIEDRLTLPLRWRKPARIFVNSAFDLFHESIPDEWIDKVFAVMALAPWHVFQVLTKRPERMRAYVGDPDTPRRIARTFLDLFIAGKIPNGKRTITDETLPLAEDRPDDDPTLKNWPLPNVWKGVSVEDQPRADERIPILLDTQAVLRWVSAEPMLSLLAFHHRYMPQPDETWLWDNWLLGEKWIEGANSINSITYKGHPRIDWVVAGAESGPGARPCDLAWVRSLRDQCAHAGVPFFFKQHVEAGRKISLPALDGVTHDAFPEVRR